MTVRVVTAPEPRVKPGMMASLINPDWSPGSPPTTGMFAVVEVDGVTFEVSQMPGESTWTADAAFRGSFPIWANGFGARYLRTKTLSDEVAAAVNAAKAVSA